METDRNGRLGAGGLGWGRGMNLDSYRPAASIRNPNQFWIVSIVLRAGPIAVLAGCDPGMHVALEKDLTAPPITAALEGRFVPLRRM